jgi:hypothetical protein
MSGGMVPDWMAEQLIEQMQVPSPLAQFFADQPPPLPPTLRQRLSRRVGNARWRIAGAISPEMSRSAEAEWD